MRRVACLLLGLPIACFAPELEIASDTDASTDTDAPTSGGTVGSASATMSTSDTTPTGSSSASTTEPSGGSSGGPAVCGDGAVQGDEACDDGVNDGSYGSCLEDCSGPAQFCGDGDLNGPEDCDDGINDGSYDGCNPDCTLAPFCGDGIENGDEACDDGTDNVEGEGCNPDCIISGSLLGDHEFPITEGFSDEPTITEPELAPNGNALVTISALMGDPVVIAEMATDVTVAADYVPIVTSGLPIRQTTRLGDQWMLVSTGCENLITAAGGFVELCDNTRHNGYLAHGAIDDDEYFGLRPGVLGKYGPGSPSVGDDTDYTVGEPDDGTFDFTFYSAALAQNASVIIAGSRASTASTLGYLTRRNNDATGSQAGSRTISGINRIDKIVSAPDGTTLGIADFDEQVFRFQENLNDMWSRSVNANSEINGTVDGAGNVILFYRDPNVAHYRLAKISADGSTDMWTIQYDAVTTVTASGIKADPNTNEIWLSYFTNDGGGFDLKVEKRAP